MISLIHGEILKNGATVINHSAAKGLVFAFVSGGSEPFVIWDIDSNGDCSNGKYYSNLSQAAYYYGAKLREIVGALK